MDTELSPATAAAAPRHDPPPQPVASTPAGCPFHAGAGDGAAAKPAPAPTAAHAPAPHPPGTWPPGPRVAATGWGLLAEMSRDTLGSLARWKAAHGDLVHLRIWPEHEVVVNEPSLVRELLVTHHDALVRWERGIQVFSRLQGQSVLTTEGEAWRRRRHALQPQFTPKAVGAFAPVIAAAAARALDDWPAASPRWDVERALTSLAMDVIVRLLFSCGIGEDARVAERALHEMMVAANAEMFWPASWPDWMPWKRRQRRARQSLDALVWRHVQGRLALPDAQWPEDLLTRLLRLHRADPQAWPLQAVRDECMTTFTAGHETLAATLTWWCAHLAAAPEVQAEVREEVRRVLGDAPPDAGALSALPALARSLQETMRLHPAAPLLFTRRCTRAVTLGGWQFPARTLFVVPLHLLHRDPRWFPQPDAFRPDRFAEGATSAPRGAWMPFGTGPRVCLGQHLAMAEMTTVAAMILQRHVLSFAPGESVPEEAFHVSLRPRQALHLRLERAPSLADRAGQGTIAPPQSAASSLN